MAKSAEYQALERVITADKRYRKFVYLLSFIFFAFVVWGGYAIQQNITRKLDAQIAGAKQRSAAREQESKTISRETIRYVTCIFVVPIAARDKATQERCFKAADLPGGLNRSDFSPIVPTDLDGVETSASQGGSSSVSSSSTASSGKTSKASSVSAPKSSNTSSNPTPTPTPPQPVIPQPVTILGVKACLPFTNICIER